MIDLLLATASFLGSLWYFERFLERLDAERRVARRLEALRRT